MRKYILVVFLLTLAWVTPANAATAKLSLDTKLTLSGDSDSTSVEHVISVESPGDVSLELPVRGLVSPTLTLRGTSTKRSFEASESKEVYKGSLLETTTVVFKVKAGEDLRLRYSTEGVMSSFGDTRLMQLSGFVGGAKQSSVSVSVPGSLGRPSLFGLDTSDSIYQSGLQTYVFDTSKSDEAVKLLFGENILWQLDWNITLKNSSWWWQKRYVALPPDTNQQRVWLESVSEQPSRLLVDRDGNLIAEYRLWPKRTLDITAKSFVDVKALFYNTSNTRPLSDVPAELKDYTSGDGTDLSGDTQVLSQVKKHYQATAEAANDIKSEDSGLTSETESLVTKMVDDLKSSGIPARTVSGVSFGSGSGQLRSEPEAARWAEVYIPGIGWMTVDPLSGQFGRADPLHIALAVTDLSSDREIEAQVEGLAVRVYDQPALPKEMLGDTSVDMKRFVLVPGLSLDRVSVAMPKGMVLDNAAIQADGTNRALGSLAPMQKLRRWSLSFGGRSMETGDVQFGRGGEQGLGDVLATGKVSVSYTPIAFVILIIALGIFLVIRAHRRRASSGKVPTLEKQFSDGTIAADDLLHDDRPGDDYQKNAN